MASTQKGSPPRRIWATRLLASPSTMQYIVVWWSRAVETGEEPREPAGRHPAAVHPVLTPPRCVRRIGCSVSRPATEWPASGQRRVGGRRDSCLCRLVAVGDSALGVFSSAQSVAPRRRCLLLRRQGQLLACLAHGCTGPVGGSTDVRDRCEQGILPEVVGLPPGDLVQEIGLGAAAQRGGGEDGELELVVLPRAECAFGQEPVPDSLT